MQTDRLSDTVCYFKAIELIQNLVKERSFDLIEHLTGNIYEMLYRYLMDLQRKDIALKIQINKVSPPVEGIHGGVSFSYFNSLAEV